MGRICYRWDKLSSSNSFDCDFLHLNVFLLSIRLWLSGLIEKHLTCRLSLHWVSAAIFCPFDQRHTGDIEKIYYQTRRDMSQRCNRVTLSSYPSIIYLLPFNILQSFTVLFPSNPIIHYTLYTIHHSLFTTLHTIPYIKLDGVAPLITDPQPTNYTFF